MNSCLQVVLRSLFEKLGATYIKLGQFIASSPTLFPEEYVLEFQKCLDKTSPIPWETIERTLNAEFEGQTNQIFSSISRVPLATASIAQVHKAGQCAIASLVYYVVTKKLAGTQVFA